MKSIWNVLTVVFTVAYFAFILIVGAGQPEKIRDTNVLFALAAATVIWLVSIAIFQIIRAAQKNRDK